MNKNENHFFKIVPVQKIVSFDDVVKKGIYIPDLIKKGYVFSAERDGYVKTSKKIELKPAGYGALGLAGIAIALITKLVQ